ncbi:MAG: ABC transporter substrate-binding protein [Chloroflexi bacterium]|nr:ABC transporter substrate-binding protein [Chloroflexota bacterium]
MRFRLLLIIVVLACFTGGVLAQESPDAPPGFANWDEVVAQANGQTVNWYLYGGSDAINGFVDSFYGPILAEEYGITLNRVPVADTVDAVNQVLSEAEAGVADDAGAVDLIWINGENFFTLRQADLLYGPWAQTLPNSALVNWDNPAINLDFGRPVDGYESPWSSAQFHLIYDSARLSEDDLPRSFAELTAWIAANPGRFTYIAPGPGGYMGTRFVKQIFFELSGGHDQWLGDFSPALYDEWAPQVWDLLNSWTPNLWRQGETYPANENELRDLFANGEVDFAFTQEISGASVYINDGRLPETARAYAFSANMIGDFNYVAIPGNAAHKAAALVLADLILRPDLQAAQVVPENGFGLGFGIDVSRVTDEADRLALEEAAASLGVGAADPQELSAALVSDLAAEYQTRVEADWEANVLRR